MLCRRRRSLAFFRGLSCLYTLVAVRAFYQELYYQQSFRARTVAETRLSVASFETSEFTYDPSLLRGKQVLSDATVLSRDPLVYLIPKFLSNDECDDFIEQVERLASTEQRAMTRSNAPAVSLNIAKLWPLPFLSIGAGIPPLLKSGTSPSMEQIVGSVFPVIATALLGSSLLALMTVQLIRLVSDASSRTSDAMALNVESDTDFIRPLVSRVCSSTKHPWHAWEAPVVTRYEPGAIFAKHGDASPTRGSEWVDLGGQRIVTCICYVNTVSEGGETSFPKLGIKVKPTKGSALVFFPAHLDSLDADDRTIHESLPPMEEKWIVQMFGRVGPRVPPPLGLPDCYDSK